MTLLVTQGHAAARQGLLGLDRRAGGRDHFPLALHAPPDVQAVVRVRALRRVRHDGHVLAEEARPCNRQARIECPQVLLSPPRVRPSCRPRARRPRKRGRRREAWRPHRRRRGCRRRPIAGRVRSGRWWSRRGHCPRAAEPCKRPPRSQAQDVAYVSPCRSLVSVLSTARWLALPACVVSGRRARHSLLVSHRNNQRAPPPVRPHSLRGCHRSATPTRWR